MSKLSINAGRPHDIEASCISLQACVNAMLCLPRVAYWSVSHLAVMKAERRSATTREASL